MTISDAELGAELRAIERERTAHDLAEAERRIAERAAEAERQRAAEQAEADANAARMATYLASVHADAEMRQRNAALVAAARAFWSVWLAIPDQFEAARAWNRFMALGVEGADSAHRAWLIGRCAGDVQDGKTALPGEVTP